MPTSGGNCGSRTVVGFRLTRRKEAAREVAPNLIHTTAQCCAAPLTESEIAGFPA